MDASGEWEGRRKPHLRTQGTLTKNGELAPLTPTCHKGLQVQPAPATCQALSHLPPLHQPFLWNSSSWDSGRAHHSSLTTRGWTSLTALFKAPRLDTMLTPPPFPTSSLSFGLYFFLKYLLRLGQILPVRLSSGASMSV